MTLPPTSKAAAQCTACGHVFSTVGNFDRHQTMPAGRVICHPPAGRGLVYRKRRGAWVMPRADWTPPAERREAA